MKITRKYWIYSLLTVILIILKLDHSITKMSNSTPIDTLRVFMNNRRFCRIIRYNPNTSRFYLDITWLIINGEYFTPQISKLLKLLPKLSILQINRCPHQESVLNISELKLQRLNLSKSPLGSGINPIQKISCLRLLDVDECNIGDQFTQIISTFHALQKLSISYAGNNRITSEGIRNIETHKIKDLTYLNISGNPIRDNGIITIARKFPNLKFLNLSGCEVTTTGLLHLKSLEKLSQLVLEEKYQHKKNYLSSGSIYRVFHNLKRISSLSVNLSFPMKYHRNLRILQRK